MDALIHRLQQLDTCFILDFFQFSFLCYLLTCGTLYILFTLKCLTLGKRHIQAGSKVLLVTAHPDDECMFFAPALSELIPLNLVHVLCITTGDYYGKGVVRKKELMESCKILGLLKQNVEIFDDSSFPDNPHVAWDLDKLHRHLSAHIDKVQPDYILTFDDKGVSSHPNHIAVSQVLKQIFKERMLSTHCPFKLYHLITVTLFRKYISFLDLPKSLLDGNLSFIASFPNILQSQRAMYAHRTQFVWFRILYVIFSRYMIINTYVPAES